MANCLPGVYAQYLGNFFLLTPVSASETFYKCGLGMAKKVNGLWNSEMKSHTALHKNPYV
jgi:hypothetical protein